uniref:5'-nucleotidase n=1 Tax=Staphylothermus marinus TaxID=2280 RepID=A0A7C4H8N7_STAMA
MPVEVFDRELFKKIAERAVECRVYRDEKNGLAKVKARTRRKLVTIKIPLNELDSFLRELKCENIVEIK